MAHPIQHVAGRTLLGSAGSGGVHEDEARALEAMANRRQEELALGAEQLEEVWLRDADPPRDRFGGGAGIPARREFDQGGADDLGAPLTCTPETEIDEVRRMMLQRHARYMPVLERRTLMGVVSFYDVAKTVVDAQDFENRMLKAYIRDWPEEGAAAGG